MQDRGHRPRRIPAEPTVPAGVARGADLHLSARHGLCPLPRQGPREIRFTNERAPVSSRLPGCAVQRHPVFSRLRVKPCLPYSSASRCPLAPHPPQDEPLQRAVGLCGPQTSGGFTWELDGRANPGALWGERRRGPAMRALPPWGGLGADQVSKTTALWRGLLTPAVGMCWPGEVFVVGACPVHEA